MSLQLKGEEVEAKHQSQLTPSSSMLRLDRSSYTPPCPLCAPVRPCTPQPAHVAGAGSATRPWTTGCSPRSNSHRHCRYYRPETGGCVCAYVWVFGCWVCGDWQRKSLARDGAENFRESLAKCSRPLVRRGYLITWQIKLLKWLIYDLSLLCTSVCQLPISAPYLQRSTL